MAHDLLTVARTTIDEMEVDPDLGALLAEYAAESANHEIGPASPQIHTYRTMEAAGLFHALAARCGGRLVGFLFLLVPNLPHFGRVVGVTESYFVAADHRKSGAGTMLRQEAERLAASLGAVGLMISAPTDGKLADVLDAHKAYRETSRVFFRRLA
jgi:GNAT superfamily N-acetyltransferase